MIPYSFLKIRKAEKYYLFNPVDNKEYVINYPAYRILEQCDGTHTIEEIAEIVVRDFHKIKTEAMDYVAVFLDVMYRLGMLAWRQEKIEYRRNSPPPSTVFWDITGACNLRCVHCYNSDEKPKETELSTEDIKRTLEEMSAFGVESLSFSGGEPLLRKDFLEIASHAGSLDFGYVGVATNGTLLNQEIVKKLKASNVSVQVSIDGDVAEIHDMIRGLKGVFDSAIRAITLLKEESLEPSVCTTVTTLNVDRIPKIVQLMQKLGVTQYRVQGIMPIGRGKTNVKKLILTPNRMKSLVEYLERENIKISSYNFTLKPPSEEPIDFCGSGACSAGSTTCSITAEGNVVPCTYFWGLNGENVRNHTFQWIWENSTVLNYFRSIRLNEIKGFCRECKWLLACHGGCKAENYADGDIFRSNRHCWVANENVKQPGHA